MLYWAAQEIFQLTAARRRLDQITIAQFKFKTFQLTAARRRLENHLNAIIWIVVFQLTAARRRLGQTLIYQRW